MGIALVQFAPNWWFVVIVFVVYMIGQFLEGNVLYPKLVGQSININPVWLMFALFAFGFLFGFVGLLLAVPLSAITATLTRYAISRYKESTLYRGAQRRSPSRKPTESRRSRPRPPPKQRLAHAQNDCQEMTPSGIGGPIALRLRARTVASRGRFHRRRRQPAGAGAYPRLSRTGRHPLTLIEGPAKSGKSHLARIWAERAGAACVPPEALEDWSREGGAAPLVVEDVDGAATTRTRCSICSTSPCEMAARC